MTDIDLDRLGDVWRQQPDPAELARLQRAGAAVARRARYSWFIDIGAGIVVSAVVLILAATNPTGRTFIMGAAAILVLLGSNIRQRKLRQVELRGLTGTTEDMLDQSIGRIETTVRHNRFTLAAIGPVFLIALLFAATAEGPGGRIMGSFIPSPTLRVLWLGGWIAFMIGVPIYVYLTLRREQRELERLRAMRDSYRKERESTGS